MVRKRHINQLTRSLSNGRRSALFSESFTLKVTLIKAVDYCNAPDYVNIYVISYVNMSKLASKFADKCCFHWAKIGNQWSPDNVACREPWPEDSPDLNVFQKAWSCVEKQFHPIMLVFENLEEPAMYVWNNFLMIFVQNLLQLTPS